MPILIFFISHWFISLFSQTFFLHRYSSHKMFKMNPFWEKFFYLLSFLSQGSSFLNPRAYAIMHRMHHTYSDTEKDPHSPHFFKDVWSMMWVTKKIYKDFVMHRQKPEKAFDGNYPTWNFIDKIGDNWRVRVLFGVLYTLFYIQFATHWSMYLLLPIHYLMGPIHGAIVNWCGHKYGYSNHENGDKSRNTLPLDFLMLGELFQNNHHKSANRANFAQKWFEFDPTYPIIKVFSWVGIIKMQRNH